MIKTNWIKNDQEFEISWNYF